LTTWDKVECDRTAGRCDRMADGDSRLGPSGDQDLPWATRTARLRRDARRSVGPRL